MDYTYSITAKNSLPNQRSRRFSSRSFVVALDLRFRSRINFEVILVCGVK